MPKYRAKPIKLPTTKQMTSEQKAALNRSTGADRVALSNGRSRAFPTKKTTTSVGVGGGGIKRDSKGRFA